MPDFVQLGPVLAIVASIVFGMGQVIIKKGVSQTGESFSAVSVGIFVGTLLFAFALLFTSDWDKIRSLSWQGWALLSIAGVIHFVAGRLLGYYSIQVIGANKSSILGRTNLLYAVIFGIIFLQEQVTAYLVLGVLFIGFGSTFVGTSREENGPRLQGKAVLTILSAAFLWGISPILIRSAMEEIGSPVAAVFISYLAASATIAVSLFAKRQREPLNQLNRSSLGIMVFGGILFATGQLLRYAALSITPVSIVAPLSGTVVIFVFIFSFFINRDIEVFSWRIFVGMAGVVTGVFLLFQ